MGVNGLLQVLKEIQDPGSLERYRGKTLAIDTYGWLHRAIVSCSQELCLGQPTRNYITYVLTKIRMLQDFNITPYFVFDGASLPTKQETNKERQQRRQEAKELAEKHLAENNPRLAEKQYMKAAYVTSQMSKSIMCELDMMGIDYVVAPYEADPQMVYLEKIGLVDGILSEDSDLLIFGCKTLITKLKDDATCYEIKRENFANVRKIPYLNQYTDEQLRLVAMLSGCDYTKGIPGVGLTKAFQMVRRYKMLEKVLIALRSTGKVAPPNFREEVELANLAFQFQKVFDPRTQEVTTLNDYPEGVELDQEVLERCCGRTLNQEIYRKLCNGEIHPNTHEILVSREQSLSLLQSKSMYSPKSRNKVRSPRRGGISASIAHRSRSEGALPPTTKPSNSVLDLLRVTKRTLHPETPKTPERVIKRPRVVYGTKEVKLSPTDRKIQKLSVPSPKGLISKFFKPKSKPVPVLPTPCSEPTAPAWNSSLAEDSDVPEGSSPEKPMDTRNVLAELTDNDEEPAKERSQEIHSSPTKEQSIDSSPTKDGSIHSSPAKEESIHSSPNKFDVYSNDDEIEESPVKNLDQPQLQTKLIALRETFSYQANTTVKLTRKSYPLNGSPKKRTPLQSKSVNLPIRRSPVKFPGKSKSLKQVDASPEGDDRIKLPPQNESPTKPRKRIDLRQFAYSVK